MLHSITDVHAHYDEAVLDNVRGEVLRTLREARACAICNSGSSVPSCRGSLALAKRFTLHAVYGNIDGGILRRIFPEKEVFYCENVKVVITHIGGYPGHYDRKIAETLRRERPQLFVCGHSHIAKVKYD